MKQNEKKTNLEGMETINKIQKYFPEKKNFSSFKTKFNFSNE